MRTRFVRSLPTLLVPLFSTALPWRDSTAQVDARAAFTQLPSPDATVRIELADRSRLQGKVTVRSDSILILRNRSQYELALAHPHEHLRFGGVDASEKLLAEYAVLGFAASSHPLALLAGALPPSAVRSDRLGEHEHGEILEVIGMVVARQRPQTAKGYVFILLEDEGGMSNVIVHPDVYDRDRLAIRGEPLLQVKGKLAKDDGTLNIIAEEVRALAVRRIDGSTGRRIDGVPEAEQPSADPPIHRSAAPAFRFLKAMRTLAPDSKDWG